MSNFCVNLEEMSKIRFAKRIIKAIVRPPISATPNFNSANALACSGSIQTCLTFHTHTAYKRCNIAILSFHQAQFAVEQQASGGFFSFCFG